MQVPLPLLIGLLSLLLLLVLLLAAALARSRARPGARSRARNAVAQQGEAEAERLLHRAGYRVVDRQAAFTSTLWVDGEAVEFGLRLDLVVERGGRHFVAEVKTGSRAPDPCFPATRRQLREYAALFPDHGLLLVDMEMLEKVLLLL